MSSTTTTTTTDTFHVVLQKGIEGGFAPPTPHARYIISRAPSSPTLTISTQIRPHGTPSLLPPVSRELAVADHLGSIARLQQILRDIPTQYPGAQDLYGRNTSIMHATNPGEVQSLHVSGSGAGFGIPPPTEEQKVLFDEAVGIVEKWGAQ